MSSLVSSQFNRRAQLRVMQLAMLACALSSLSTVVNADFNLTLLHTNDVENRIEETDRNGKPCTDEVRLDQGGCYGGVARRATAVREIRSEVGGDAGNVLFVDAGDQFQGTDWFYVYGGNATAHFMNLLGYDAMSLGKTEFYRGISGLVDFLGQANFTAVSSNIDATNEPRMMTSYVRRHVIAMGGERVGVVGCTNPTTPIFTKTGNLTFLPVIAAMQSEVDALVNDEGVNKIVALSDCGFDLDQEIASSVRGVDIVVGGNWHVFLYTGEPPEEQSKAGEYPLVIHPSYNESLSVLIVTDFAYGKYLGLLEVTFDDNGVVTSYGGNPILLNASVEMATDIAAEVAQWKEVVDEVSFTVVGYTDVYIDGAYAVCGIEECNMGNLIADAMLENHGMGWEGVHVALTTAGSFASSIDAGDIRVNDLTRVIPYGDSIDLLEMTGATLMEMLETQLIDFDPPTLTTAFLQISGMRVEYNISRPNGERVMVAELKCAPCGNGSDRGYEAVNASAVYKVILNSYVAGGKEGYTFLPESAISQERGRLDVDIVIDYLAEHSPISPTTEGRIVIHDDDDDGNGGVKSGAPFLATLLLLTVVLLMV